VEQLGNELEGFAVHPVVAILCVVAAALLWLLAVARIGEWWLSRSLHERLPEEAGAVRCPYCLLWVVPPLVEVRVNPLARRGIARRGTHMAVCSDCLELPGVEVVGAGETPC
jgi:hypothetical protein